MKESKSKQPPHNNPWEQKFLTDPETKKLLRVHWWETNKKPVLVLAGLWVVFLAFLAFLLAYGLKVLG